MTRKHGATNALVIGATGGIAKALLIELVAQCQFNQVFGVTRSPKNGDVDGVKYIQADSVTESSIESVIHQLSQHGQFSLIVCCIGTLLGEHNGIKISPEKRMEDVSSEQLQSYMLINAIAPMLWIKHVQPLVKGGVKSQIVVLSARVGSIADNKLGGWYGYRASKAALNMLVKTAQIEYQRRAKNVELISYHPGTVDTELSKPFQTSVPKEKLFSAKFTATSLLTHLKTLEITNSPHYIDWNNQTIQW